jgi:integrase
MNGAMERMKITKRSVLALKPAAAPYMVDDDTLDGFSIRVTPDGSKTFYVYYRVKGLGTRRRPALGKFDERTFTVENARDKAEDFIFQAKNGKDPSAEIQEARKIETFQEFAETYMLDAAARVKPRTLEENQRRLDLHLLPALGSKKLSAITRNDVARLHQRFAEKKTVERKGKLRGEDSKDGKSYERTTGGPTLANKSLALLKSMFSTAERWGAIPEGANPCRHIRPYKEKPRERYLTPDELNKLAEAINGIEAGEKASPWAIEAIRLLMLTGARRDEILTLQWSFVDAEARVLRLPDSKTGAKVIHLNSAALEVMTRLAQIREEGNPYVIVGHKRGERLVNITKPWYRVRTAAELTDLRLHDLRHVYAGMGAALGLGLPVVGKLLGHSQPRTTARYANLSPDPVAAANERIGEALVAAMTKGKAQVVDAAKEGAEKASAKAAG